MEIRIDQVMTNVMEHEGSGIGALCDVVMTTTEGRIRHGAMMDRETGICIETESGSEGGGWTCMLLRILGTCRAVVLVTRPLAGDPVPPLVVATSTDQFHRIGDMMEADLLGPGHPAAITTPTRRCDLVPERLLAARG